MRVGFDLTYAGKQEGTGTYIRNLVNALARLPEVEIVPFIRPRPALLGCLPRPLARLANGLLSIVWLQGIVPLQARRRRLDLFHAPAFVAPLLLPCPLVLTILDAVPVAVGLRNQRLWKGYLSAFLRLSARRAAKVVTLSDHAALEIAPFVGAAEDAIKPIPLGVSPRFRVLPPPKPVLPAELGVMEPFILFVGAGDARKNYTLALRGLALLRERGIPQPLLVVTGKPTDEFRCLAERAQAAGEARVCFLGVVSEETLVILYNRARALVFPSRYEGFGLPVLEAMACGCPVICSGATSLREVAGDAALLVDPDDADSLANALAGVIADPALAANLAMAGLARARAFTWATTAARTLAVYREVC